MNLDRKDLWTFLVLLAIPFAYFCRAALGLGVFFHFDIIMQFYPYKAHFMDGLRSGHLPLWCPLIYSGFPLFAEGQAGALYPPQVLLYLLLPAHLAYNHATLLHIGLAGGFTYLYLRVLGLTRPASALGGLVFMFGGFCLARVRHFNILLGAAWLPCLFLLIELFQQRRRWRFLGLAGVVTSFLFLAAHPYVTMYSLMGIAAYLAFHAFFAPGGLMIRARNAVLALAIILPTGVGLAAVQILPTYELLNASVRALPPKYLFLAQGSFPPSNLLTFLIPNHFGAPATDTYWGTPSEGFYIEFSAYCGLLPLVLAFVAVRRRRDPHTLFFALLALAALLLAFGGYTILYRLVAHVPLLGSSRVPARFLLLVSFSIAVLAAKGLDAGEWANGRIGESANRRRGRFASWLIRLFAYSSVRLFALAASAALLIVGILLLHRAWLLATPADLASRYGLHGYLLDKVGRISTQSLRPALINFAVFAALTVAWLGYPAYGPPITHYASRFTFYASAILITLADLLLFAWHLNPTISPAVYETAPAAARFLLAQERSTPPPRLYRWNVREAWSLDAHRGRYDPFSQGWANHPERFSSCAESLAPNIGMLWLIPAIEGFGITSLQAYNEMLGVGHKRDSFMPYDLSAMFADLLNVGHVLTSRILPERDLALNLPDLDLRLYRNPGYLPRAFLVHDWKALPSRHEVLSELHSDRFNPRQYALLTAADAASLSVTPSPHHPNTPSLHHSNPPVAIQRYASDEVVMATDARADALLVLGDVHYPGWRAWLDGRRQPILRANYALRGISAPQGSHTHHLVYNPRSFKLGAALTLIALATIAALVSLRLRFTLYVLRLPPAALRSTEYALRTTHYGLILLSVLSAAAVILILSALFIPDPWRQLPQRLTVNFYLGCECDANGRHFYKEGKIDEAIRELQIVVRVLPNDPTGYYNLGGLYLAKGDKERAAQEWQKALAINPSHRKALEALQKLRGR